MSKNLVMEDEEEESRIPNMDLLLIVSCALLTGATEIQTYRMVGGLQHVQVKQELTSRTGKMSDFLGRSCYKGESCRQRLNNEVR